MMIHMTMPCACVASFRANSNISNPPMVVKNNDRYDLIYLFSYIGITIVRRSQLSLQIDNLYSVDLPIVSHTINYNFIRSGAM